MKNKFNLIHSLLILVVIILTSSHIPVFGSEKKSVEMLYDSYRPPQTQLLKPNSEVVLQPSSLVYDEARKMYCFDTGKKTNQSGDRIIYCVTKSEQGTNYQNKKSTDNGELADMRGLIQRESLLLRQKNIQNSWTPYYLGLGSLSLMLGGLSGYSDDNGRNVMVTAGLGLGLTSYVMWQNNSTNSIQIESLLQSPIDRRSRLEDDESINGWPYKVHGWLQMEFPDFVGVGIGSATLINKNQIITAAHNVFDRSTKKEATSVIFGIGNKGGDAFVDKPTKSIPNAKIIKINYPPQYATEISDHDAKKYDYAVLTLDTSLGQDFGYLGLGQLIDTSVKLNVSGYPGDVKFGANRGNKMYTMEGQCVSFSEYASTRMFYDIDTTPGQSGSGVWVKHREDHSCVGVHAYGIDDRYCPLEKKYNSGSYFNDQNLRVIREWIPATSIN